MATCKDCIHYYVCNSKGANCREDISSGSKAKYIDVKELSIILDIMKNPDSKFATDDYIDGFSDGISAVIKELEIMPNEDVVKIVRCKDCKYYSKMYKLCSCRSDKFNVYLNNNDFCSYGERMVNNG